MDSEAELQHWLKHEFEEHGWRARREVTPIGSNYRADLIVYHENWGHIGIECKYMSSLRNGKKIGKALDQIIYQYRGKRYPYCEGKVNLWAFCPYIERQPEQCQGIRQTVRETLCHFGVGTIWPDAFEMVIDFAYSGKETKIQLSDEKGEEYGDIDRIENMVAKKMRLHDSDRGDLGTCQYDSSGHGCTAPAVETVTVGDYEINLCKHHTDAVEKARWKSEKELRETA